MQDYLFKYKIIIIKTMISETYKYAKVYTRYVYRESFKMKMNKQ